MINAAPYERDVESKREAPWLERQQILKLLTFGDPKLDEHSGGLEKLSEKTAPCRGYLREQFTEDFRRSA